MIKSIKKAVLGTILALCMVMTIALTAQAYECYEQDTVIPHNIDEPGLRQN